MEDMQSDVLTEPVAASTEEVSTDLNSKSQNDALLAEAEGLKEIYPEFDLAAQMEDPLFRGMCRGEIHPNMKQIYEMFPRVEERLKQPAETLPAANSRWSPLPEA